VDLQKQFPDVKWELLIVPSRKKPLRYVDLIICCAQLYKNHKDTDWVENEARKSSVQIIRPQGGGTQIGIGIQKFIDDLSK